MKSAPPPSDRPARRRKPGASSGRAPVPESWVLADAVLDAYDLNERANRMLLDNLPEAAWTAEPPGGKGRTIAGVAAHVHNVRLMWLKASAPGAKLPAKLDRATVTRAQALAAFAKSHAAMVELVAPAVRGDGRIKNFPRGVAAFLAYLMAHEAHHRGQICMLARQVGHGLSQSVQFGLWEWGKTKHSMPALER